MKTIICIVMLISLVVLPKAHATNEREREKLVQLLSELQVARSIALGAQNISSPNSDEKFKYDKLIRDLNEMSSAVERHLSERRRQPRQINELYLEY